MSSKRTFYIMIALVVLLVAAILGGTYLANKQLQTQSAKLLEYKVQDELLTQEQAGLTKAKKDVEKYRQLEKIAKSVVPQDKDQAKAVREIVKIAAESGIKPTSITFPVSNLGAASVAAPAPGTATSPSTKSAGVTPSQLTPVKGITGVFNLQIVIQSDTSSPVPYDRFIDFIHRLENNRRTAQVSSIIIQPTANNRNMVAFTLTVDEFIKP